MDDCWEIKRPKYNKELSHQARFPKILVRKILDNWKSDIVLDPFMGSGTTAAVCEILGKKWIGIELFTEYCEVIKKRVIRGKRKNISRNMFFNL